MSELDISGPSPDHLTFKATHLSKLAGAALVYIGIVAMFLSATLAIWFISLLIA